MFMKRLKRPPLAVICRHILQFSRFFIRRAALAMSAIINSYQYWYLCYNVMGMPRRALFRITEEARRRISRCYNIIILFDLFFVIQVICVRERRDRFVCDRYHVCADRTRFIIIIERSKCVVKCTIYLVCTRTLRCLV